VAWEAAEELVLADTDAGVCGGCDVREACGWSDEMRCCEPEGVKYEGKPPPVHCDGVVTEPIRDCRHSVLMFQVIARAVG